MNIVLYVKLSRPVNVLISMIAIWVAAAITPGFEIKPVLVYACITAGFITAGANIVNDIFDIDIDRINKPQRPIASGAVSVGCAWIWFWFSYAAGLWFAWISGLSLFLLALLFAVFLYWYSARLKRVVFWGNFMVSLSTGVAFIYGAMAVSEWKYGIMPALFAFGFHFGREIIKDMQDVAGDSAFKATTFPIRFGMRKSALLVNIVFGVLIILTVVPYIVHIYNAVYLIIVLAGVDLFLLAVSVLIWKRNDPAFLGKISFLLKMDMFIGLIAIYLG